MTENMQTSTSLLRVYIYCLLEMKTICYETEGASLTFQWMSVYIGGWQSAPLL